MVSALHRSVDGSIPSFFQCNFAEILISNTMKKSNKQTELQLLVQAIEILVMKGYDISFLVGKPLSHFNFDAIKSLIEREEKEEEENY